MPDPWMLLNMAVAGNVIFAIAVVALAAGAVPEFQIRIAHIGAAANGAAMGIGDFLLFRCGFGLCVKGNDFGPLGSRMRNFLAKHSGDLSAPCQGDNVQYVLAEE